MNKKKRIKELEKRIKQLEKAQTVETYDFGRIDLRGLCKALPSYIKKQIRTDIAVNNNRSDT